MVFDPLATLPCAAGKLANRAGFVDTGPRPQAACHLFGLAQAAAAVVVLIVAVVAAFAPLPHSVAATCAT